MNKTTIEWVISEDGTPGFTSNPISGCLGPGGTLDHPRRCPGCYAATIATRWGKTPAGKAFLPEYHPERLDLIEKRKTPATIFVGSMADGWGDWVPKEWILSILRLVLRTERHRFIFLTKNPKRYREFSPFPPNVWIGASTRTQSEWERARAELSDVEAPVRFISAEPMLGPIQLGDGWKPDWVIIGDLTRAGAPQGKAKDAWVQALTAEARRAKIPVFHKDSLTARGHSLRELPGGNNAYQRKLF